MLILLFLLSLTYSSLNLRFSVVDFLSPLSAFFHQRCLYLLPSSVVDFPEMAALVCGHNFENAADSQIYKSSGLIHLFVVSGSHLILIKKILDRCKVSPFLIVMCLLVYCLCSLLNPPVVRSCVFLIVTLLLRKHMRLWPNHYLILISGLLCLVSSPKWIGSLSLQMSWIAGLVLACCSGIKFESYDLPFFRQVIFYLLFSLTYFGLGFPSPSIIPLSILVSPILEFILFPLCLITTVFHFLEPLPKFLVEALNSFLLHLEFSTQMKPIQNSAVNAVVAWNWLIICFIHTYLYFKRSSNEEVHL